MIYLDNNTNPQEIFIERNDGNGYVHTGSSQSYQEGYEDGIEYQKSLLSSTAFTENGEYERENGWSAITVNAEPSLEEINVVISADTTTITPSSGYDGFSAVTVDATEYGQTNYDSGFDDGYTDGYSSGSSEGYDSGYTEGYQSGSTDGFNSGYTSGETHQKSLLGTTAFTINGSYSAENGYSAITVNVPTGQTYNIEQNKPFTATSNGNYTINPSEIWSITYDHIFARTYDFTINGTIPQSFVNDTAYVVRYYDEMTEEEPRVVIKVRSGNTLYLNKNGWDEDDYGNVEFRLFQGKYRLEFDNDDLDSSEFSIIPYSNGEKYDVMSAVSLNVNVPQTGTSATLGVGSFSANGTYSASTDNLDGYSAITINVPTSGHSVKYLEYIETNGTQIGWDTGYNIGTDIDAKIYLDFMPISGGGYGDYWFAYYGDCAKNVLFRRAGNYAPIGFMFGNNSTHKDYSDYSVVNGNRYLISLDKNGITDENTGTLLVAASSSSINSTKNLYLNFEGLDRNNQVNRCIRARYYSFRVENGNGETTLDMRPCLDGNNVPCFYDEVSQTYIYHIGSGTPIAGPIVDESYESGYTSGYTDGYDSGYTSGYTDGQNSGYTEGYNSGYTEGQNDVISTFSSITITQNGQYGDSVHPMSSITVNVPQSGYSINDLALRNYTINNPSITASTIEESAFEGCSGLTGNLELGSSVWVIKEGAFCGSSISEIIWPQNIDGGAFSVTSMTMRDGCQFAECQNLEYVEVPSYVTFSSVTINSSSGMFYNCKNLVNVDYYASKIPTRCFDGCIGLEYIYIDNITSIGQKAFYGCTHLTSIRFAQQNPPTVSNSDAFSYVPSGGTLYVPFGRSSAYQSYLNYLTNWTIVEDEE